MTLGEINASESWFAVQVKSKSEQRVAISLEHKGYGVLGLCWHSRERATPVFPGYVFCRPDNGVAGRIVFTPGVIRILGTGHCPTPLEAHEIVAVRRIVETAAKSQPWPYVASGEVVQIARGPLAGLQGFLIGNSGANGLVVVSVTLLQRSLKIAVDARCIRSMSRSDKVNPDDTWRAPNIDRSPQKENCP